MIKEIDVNMDMVLISIYNGCNDEDNKISLNNKEFFENSFDNAYDAAYAVSLSGQWTWSDDYVYFDEDGYLMSFSHWDDENSPIDADRLDISQLIEGLKKWTKKEKEDNLSMSIHDALK